MRGPDRAPSVQMYFQEYQKKIQDGGGKRDASVPGLSLVPSKSLTFVWLHLTPGLAQCVLQACGKPGSGT